ncbi:enoyl-CoA hydratase-related protein [Corynebacterium sp. P3-F1]|uniref:enoyl-CoA hydratase-related protein n=1 Tax=Corynebacterium sp. P3-F1 TaxID=3059080 RepID=UPI00265CE2A2|nr:enoyl-CoA hydratase-related protein [Corynebacterium sp. P3-F1]WKK62167.1 enoyl-CoA hydratase-related protein [Corynebacterium sp. P3-F1]
MLINVTRPADGIVALTLSRDEKRNALSEELLVALEGELERALIDASSVLLTGAGSAFSAGADLSAGDPAGIYPSLKRVVDMIRGAEKAVVAYVNGPAIGAGAMLAGACDIRVVAPSARFAIPVAKMGVPVPPGLAAELAGLVGGARARTMLMTGMPLNAAVAVDSGFAALRGMYDDAVEVAKVCAAGNPATIASIKSTYFSE